jgi:hypothetical protein
MIPTVKESATLEHKSRSGSIANWAVWDVIGKPEEGGSEHPSIAAYTADKVVGQFAGGPSSKSLARLRYENSQGAVPYRVATLILVHVAGRKVE